MGQQIKEMMDWAGRRKALTTVFVTLTLCLGILIGTVISGRVSAMKALGATGGTPLAIPDPVALSSSFAGIATRVEPAVVNISTTQVLERRPGRQRVDPNQPDDQQPFQDFFNRFFNGKPDGGAPEAERSLGSGMIVDKRGFILTNNHVVENATKVQVQLNGDSTMYNAKVVGTDEETDLAVIKIDAGKDLPVAKLGNSDGAQVGDWVLAIGSPFGLQATVTAGIISAKDRHETGVARQFQRFIQTDAAINPGNSGGPLVDLAGEVIGINTAIMTGSRGYEGVGFALPSSTAIGVYNQIVEHGRVTRGSIGVSFTEERGTSPITLKALGAANGVVLEDVTPGSPAEKAGLKAGDVITSVNGNVVKTGNDMVMPIAQSAIGAKVRIGYVRDSQPKETWVTVEDRTKVFPDRAGRASDQPDENAPAELGLRVENMNTDRARRAGWDGVAGVHVVAVEPASFAEDVGFAPDDVITEVNHTPVKSVSEYHDAILKLKAGQDVVFKVSRRQDTDRILTVYLPGVMPSQKDR